MYSNNEVAVKFESSIGSITLYGKRHANLTAELASDWLSVSENVPEFVSDLHAWKPVPPLNAANEVEANSLGVQNVHGSASPRARITTRFVTMGCWESFGSRPVWFTAITAACYEYSGIGALEKTRTCLAYFVF